MVTPHDGIIDGIIRRAEEKVGTDGALPPDLILAVIAAYHREEYQQVLDMANEQKERDESVIKALQDINTTLQNHRNGNGSKRIRDRAKSAAIPLIGGSSGIGLLIYAKDLLALAGV